MADNIIYLDSAATTPVHPEVWRAMEPYALTLYGNPAAVYSFAGKAKRAVNASREQLAALIGAKPREIYFTSGGTESDNWALKAAAESGGHIITTAVEHHAVLNTCRYLESRGVRITVLPVDRYGMADPAAIEAAICPDTVLISVMAANNEIGTINPIGEIGTVARRHGVLFHTDAVQAFGHIPLDVDSMNIDLLSASAHKLGGPKGTGLLYIRSGASLAPLMHGGAQERGIRAGTLNVAGIVGFGKAAEIAGASMAEDNAHLLSLRDHLIERVLNEIPDSRLNGHPQTRLANNASFCFPDVEGETLLFHLSQSGICASSGSACATGSEEPSHVLRATGVPDSLIRGSLRLTLSGQTTLREIDYTVDRLKEILAQQRLYAALGREV